MHPEAYRYVANTVRDLDLKDAARVLEIGSFNVNGTIRGLFDTSDYVGVDVRPGPGVDVVCDGADYRSDTKFDVIVCCETLEHAPNAPEIIANAAAHLKRDGVAIFTIAGVERDPHGCNGGPVFDEFYRGVSEDTLYDWTADVFGDVIIITNPDAGDIYATALQP